MQAVSRNSPPSSRRGANLFIVVFLLFQAVMIVRCYWTDAKFFGWQMFSRPLVYRARYFGTREDGVRQPLPEDCYRPWIDKHGNSNFCSPTKDLKVFSRGKEYLFAEMKRVPGFLCGKLAGQGYRKIEVEMERRDVGESGFSVGTFSKDC